MAGRVSADEFNALKDQVIELRAAQKESERLQTATLRRLQFLPQGLGQLLQAENVSAGIITADGQGMSYEIGADINITIWPFADKFELSDTRGRMKPLKANFGTNTDVSPTMVMQIVGFQTLAARDNPFGDAGYLSEQLQQLSQQ